MVIMEDLTFVFTVYSKGEEFVKGVGYGSNSNEALIDFWFNALSNEERKYLDINGVSNVHIRGFHTCSLN